MNTYTRNMNPENPGFAGSAAANGKISFAGFAAKITLLILLIFFAVYAQMYLRAEIERLNKRAVAIQASINQRNMQCTNLRNQREALTSWDHISSRITRYRLGLRAASPRQITRLTVNGGRGSQRTVQAVRSGNSSSGMHAYARIDR